MRHYLLLFALATAVLTTVATHASVSAAPKARQKREARDQESRVRMKDLPPAVQQTVREQSKGAVIRGLSRETEKGVTNYEVELRVGDHNKDVLISPSGEVVEIEEQVTLASLPPAVKTTIEQNAGRGKIVSIESITKDTTITAYEAHVRGARKSREIKVSAEGQLIH
ncbi:MAG: hypothetical protein QOJ70_3090 [Acidobacteriota bacterium]|jgi:hypothetical protein|nr:hypothetical protein [Acidobacteriota bacterium]